MLPAHLAENIRKQVLFYLESTFDFRERQVHQAVPPRTHLKSSYASATPVTDG